MRWCCLVADSDQTGIEALSGLMAQLPRAYGEPSLTASFKREAEDFCVDEELGFECSGQGEHLWVQVRKTGITTLDALRRLARVAGVNERQISYSGLKDKHGVCTQWFSIHSPGPASALGPTDLRNAESDELCILQSCRNGRKLRRGSHRENHFRICLRDLGPVSGSEGKQAIADLETKLNIIAGRGVPNYFGEQRFGFNNLAKAAEMFRSVGRRPARTERGLLLSATRSALFNAVLAERVISGEWCGYLPGDVMNLDGTGSVFAADATDDQLVERLNSLDIHPTGPLWGKGELRSLSGCRELEMVVCTRWADLCRGLERAELEQQRRSLRLPVKALHYRVDPDATLKLSFSLPRGSYATAVLHELVDYRTVFEERRPT